MAVVSAIVTFAGVAADDEELRAMQNRLPWVLQIDEGSLPKIAHEHTCMVLLAGRPGLVGATHWEAR